LQLAHHGTCDLGDVRDAAAAAAYRDTLPRFDAAAYFRPLELCRDGAGDVRQARRREFLAHVDHLRQRYVQSAGYVDFDAILDHLGASIAAAEWHAATPSALTFRILTTMNPSPVAVPLAGSGFHTITFSVTSAGEASWALDGTVVMTVSGFPNDMVRVQLYDNIGATSTTSFAQFRFDDVLITSP